MCVCFEFIQYLELETGETLTDDDILSLVMDEDSTNDDEDEDRDTGHFHLYQKQTSNSSLKTRGAAAPALELLGVFLRFRRTFAEDITFNGASAQEF